jgi:hypothetical protein
MLHACKPQRAFAERQEHAVRQPAQLIPQARRLDCYARMAVRQQAQMDRAIFQPLLVEACLPTS